MRAWTDALLHDEAGALKLLLVGVLTLALLAPLALVEGVIAERAERHDAVLAEIARQHGGEQRLVGPVIMVPFEREDRTSPLRARVDDIALLLPAHTAARADLAHEIRRRGVYEAPVYAADIVIEGVFVRPNLAASAPDLAAVHWDQAALVMGVSDAAGLADVADLVVGDARMPFAPGAPAFAAGPVKEQSRSDSVTGFVHAPFPIAAGDAAPITFRSRLRVNGSGGLFLAPAARESRIAIAGDWPHPSFQGAPLPTARRVGDAGFEAEWRVPGLARGFSDVVVGAAAAQRLDAIRAHGVGLRHARPDDAYVAAHRAAKYGVLLIALTFVAGFVLERFGESRLHLAQYGLIGLSLALFYVLLTALAERIGLTPAYVAAAGVIALLNGGYVGTALRSLRRGLGAGAALAALYAAFYVMLASEDDALLIGALLLLLGLALAMAATARLNRRAPATAGPAQPERG